MRCLTEGLVWLLDLRAMAHAFMPSPWGMFVYKEDTSRVTRKAGIWVFDV